MTTALFILSIFLVILIMFQSKGAGLSIMSSGSEDFGKFERRGPEKVLHQITIISVIAYIALAVAIYIFA